MSSFHSLRLQCLILVLSLVTAAASAAETARPLKALFVTGGCCHEYDQQKRVLTDGISARAKVDWTIVHEGGTRGDFKVGIYTNANWAAGYDVVVHDECFADVKDAAFVQGILKAHKDGVPAVNLHCAMHSYRVNFEQFKDWFAFTGIDSRGHGPQLPIAIQYVKTDHPITVGFTNWTTIKEELYNTLQIWETVTPLARGKQVVLQKDGTSKEVETMITWVNDYQGTRVFNTTLGHNTETCADPRYLDLVTRGLLWACDRLDATGQPKAGYAAK
jgi:type 1 glutamine amidotransferase